MINIFAGFEASGNGVDGEEKSVADPVPQSWYEPDLYWVMGVLQEVKKSVLGWAIILNYN